MNLEIGYDLDTLLGSVALDYKLVLGENANGDTPIYWGDVASGECFYYYINEDGVKSLEKAQFYFNSQEAPHEIFTSDKMMISGVKKENPTTASISVFTSRSGQNHYYIQYSSGGVYALQNSLTPYSDKLVGAVKVWLDGFEQPTFNLLLSGTSNSWSTVGFNGTCSYTTIPAVHTIMPNVPYMPVSGRTMSYNDVRQYVVNEYNEQNPSETITVDDLPAFDEDETEATYDIQPFSLDYDEILGEKEMESIIAETRYILDTTPYEIESLDYQQAISEPYGQLKEIAVLDNDTKTAMSKIYDVAERITRNDFLSLYAFSAIISIVMWFVFRR